MAPAPPVRSWAGPGLVRVTAPVSLAVLIIATAGIGTALPGESAPVIAVAAITLLAAAAATAVVFLPRSHAPWVDTAALMIVGAAGAVLGGLLPGTDGFVLVYLSLGALGMQLPTRRALPAGLAVCAALIAAFVAAGVPGDSMAAQAIGAAFVFAIGAFARYSRIAQQDARSERERAEDLVTQLVASQAALRQAATLTERARLAREIHDILAHALSGLVLGLDTMELLCEQATTDPQLLGQLLEQVRRGQRIARDGLADTRSAIAALRGDDLPGPALLDQLVLQSAASGIRARLTLTGRPRPLQPEVGLAVYRTAQEALTNTAKHAGPGAGAELLLAYTDDGVELAIDDDGPGLAGQASVGHSSVRLTSGGYGLTGMRERAELLGGSLEAGPSAGGFAVRLRLPASARSEPDGASRGAAP